MKMSIKKINKAIKQDMKNILEPESDPDIMVVHNRDTYQMVAVGGDMSATGGMSNVARIVEVKAENFETMNQWMRMCGIMCDYSDETLKYRLDIKYKDHKGLNEMNELMATIRNTEKELWKQLNEYLTDKYYARTTWAWMQTPDWDFVEETA
jgi:hypothetical protein